MTNEIGSARPRIAIGSARSSGRNSSANNRSAARASSSGTDAADAPQKPKTALGWVRDELLPTIKETIAVGDKMVDSLNRNVAGGSSAAAGVAFAMGAAFVAPGKDEEASPAHKAMLAVSHLHLTKGAKDAGLKTDQFHSPFAPKKPEEQKKSDKEDCSKSENKNKSSESKTKDAENTQAAPSSSEPSTGEDWLVLE